MPLLAVDVAVTAELWTVAGTLGLEIKTAEFAETVVVDGRRADTAQTAKTAGRQDLQMETHIIIFIFFLLSDIVANCWNLVY